ncbi:MAG: SBBP repeat-containing protein [Candidatus Hodarchaeota archaeon]
MKIKNIHILLFILICFLLIFLTSKNEFSVLRYDSKKNNEFPISSATNAVEYKWNVTWGGTGEDRCEAITNDSLGNMYLVGYTGYANACLVKYDSLGVQQWNHTIGGMWYDFGYDVAVDSSGNVYLAGTTETYSSSTFPDMWLIKYDSNGVHQWNITWGGTYYEICYAIALDSSDNIYLGGWIDEGNRDICLVKFDSSGVEQWSRTWGDTRSDYGYDVAVDSSDNVYIAGEMNSTGSPYGLNDFSIMCFVKYDSSGTELMNRTWGAGQDYTCYGITIDSSNNIYLAGEAGHPGVSSDGMTLVKYNSLGEEQWNYTEPDLDSCANDIILDSSEDIYIAGVIWETGYQLQMILAKYNSFGDQQWNYTWGGGLYEECKGLTLDSVENIFLGGDTTSFGAGGRDMCLVKLTPVPLITIESPDSNELFGSNAPEYNITIIESNLDSTWYTLNDSADIPFSGTEGTIDPTEWNSLGNGTVSIKFYANNSAGGIGMSEVIVHRDIEEPVITIISPEEFDFFSFTAPSFTLSIDEANINSTWYTLNDSAYIPFSGTSGDIDPTEWGYLGNGSVIIKFFANDTVGNEGNSSVLIYKDIEIPQIDITSPVPDEVFGYDPPDFTLSITETNRNSTWYTLNDSAYIPFSGDSGTIDPTEWGYLSNGTVTIRFYINDSAGNENNDVVTVHKDIEPPQITVDSPYENEFFGEDPPDFSLTIIEGNPNTTWYNLDGGTNITCGLSGTIDPLEWGPLGDGPIEITFYANDSMNNLGFFIRTVNKDTTNPIVKINSPIGYEFFGAVAPDYNITVTGSNLNTTWFNFNDGENKTLNSDTGTLDQTLWGNEGNGTVIIKFFANNSANNIGQAEVLVFKDIEIPSSSIFFIPHSGTNNVNISTTFNITADDGMGSGINLIRYRINNSIWVDYIGQFDLSTYPYGDYLISYYSIDNVGNSELPNSILVKLIDVSPEEPEEPELPEIPGYNLIFLLSLVSIAIIGILIKKRK